MFAEQSVPGYTRLEMINLAKAYFGLSGMANSFHKHELVEYFADPSRRPSIQAVVEDRREQAGAARTARLETITKGLERRPGRWRFAAVARLPEHVHVDEVSGAEVKGGLLLRDTKTAEPLAVGYVTATEMKRRRRLTFYDKDRLPMVGQVQSAAPITDRIDAAIDKILDSHPIVAAEVAGGTTSSDEAGVAVCPIDERIQATQHKRVVDRTNRQEHLAVVLVRQPQLTHHEKEIHLRDSQFEMLPSRGRLPTQRDVVTEVVGLLLRREDTGLVDPTSEVR